MQKYLPWVLRIIIFILFIVSGITKMFPLWAFEKQLVDLGICGWCQAPFLARSIIALELALGIAMLQPHFLKRIIIPSTILLLVAFCVHLSIQMVQFGPNNGNCGCFGQLIPMTPLEAFIKNIITIAILIYLYMKVKDRENSHIVYPLIIFLAATLFMFVAFPFCPCDKEKTAQTDIASGELMQITTPENFQIKDTIPVKADTTKKATPTLKDTVKASVAKAVAVVVEEGPAKTSSRFAAYNTYNNKKINPDEGKKVFCMFAPGCDHCRATAKEICGMKGKAGFPEVYIIFMDEEANLIPDFFKEAGCSFPHQVLDIPKFWQLLGTGATTPGVICLWNGNIVKSFEGIENNKFEAEGMKKAYGLK